MNPDKITKSWIRDASDEYAISKGCWFDEDRGNFVVKWMYDYLRLYEGEAAGQPLELLDWAYDVTMRMFGWVRQSDEWGKTIRRFRKACIYISKKNGKSPTLAGWCVYMCCGDGVMGQKCFPTAKDGSQIKENVGRHIFEMVRQSEALSSECTINKMKASVFHEPTRSLILPLSSDNIRTQKSKEGLNGSVFVDETHVVDKAHMRRISRAGISRPEPLQIEVSTAGDEPESYGYGRFQYAEGIASGVNKDIETLSSIWAAPQDLKDEELLANPEKYAKMANPAFGKTVMLSEWKHDLETSKATPSDLADFKMYRLNIWQQSASPWISVHDWDACPSEDTELEQWTDTFGGLDLSRVTDLTAVIMYQPKLHKLRGHYWCPRDRALELSKKHEIPLLLWADQGWLTLCEGRTIDRSDIHEYLEEVEQTLEIRYMGYDKWNADDTVKYCETELGWEMVEVSQGMSSMCGPTKALRDLIMDVELDHSNDPVLRWMFQNVSVERDKHGNEAPIKAPGGVRKHIDGIVAAIMSIKVAMAEGEEGEIEYEAGDAIL